MISIFRNQVCLPFFFYELLEEHSQQGMTADSVVQAFTEAFGKAPTEQTLKLIIERLMAEAKEVEEELSRPRKGASHKKVFGTGLSEYLAHLDVDSLCLLLADHDPIKAKLIYSQVDMRHAIAAAKAKTGLLAELAGVWYEAVMFGMGGHYKGSGPKDKVVDLTEDSSQAIPMLKSLGLM